VPIAECFLFGLPTLGDTILARGVANLVADLVVFGLSETVPEITYSDPVCFEVGTGLDDSVSDSIVCIRALILAEAATLQAREGRLA
jgi:hypothetical protein